MRGVVLNAPHTNRKFIAWCFSREKGGTTKMPMRPNVPCGHPGCASLVPYGQKYCEKHKAMHPEETRPAGKRGYGSRWQRLSKEYLQAHPLCVQCQKNGHYTRATVVDHIIPHRGDRKLFWDPDNWQALCKPCHDRKTFTEDIRPVYEYRF